ncbi:hypothetical protein [Alteromonas sp. CYL-A6]|uniref:hypothetical protein n=1 Tax=Alteromonas nitratireducens TaxID=3390813 RepID=UPI0034A8A95E
MTRQLVAFFILMLVCVRVVATTGHAVCNHQPQQDNTTAVTMAHSDCMQGMTEQTSMTQASDSCSECCEGDCQCDLHFAHSPVFLPVDTTELTEQGIRSLRTQAVFMLPDGPVSVYFRPPRHT